MASTRRAKLCIGEFGALVKFKLENNNLTISANSQKMDFTDELPVEYTQEAFDVAFNPDYIIDVLKISPRKKFLFRL